MIDDRSLVEKVLSGDLQAFKILINQNERLVAHMVGRLIQIKEDREEICQDVFMKVYEKLEKFNFKSKLSTWIATIAYRQSINYLQKKNIKIDKDLEGLNSMELGNLVENRTPEKQLQEEDVKVFFK